MRMKIDPYDYELVYRPGRDLVLADTLSRAAVTDLAEQHENGDVNAVYVESTTQSCRAEL